VPPSHLDPFDSAMHRDFCPRLSQSLGQKSLCIGDFDLIQYQRWEDKNNTMQWTVQRDDPASSLIYAAAAASRVSGPLACRRRAAPAAAPTPPLHTQRCSNDARTGRAITAAQPHSSRASVAHSPPPPPRFVTPTAARMRAESAADDVASRPSHHKKVGMRSLPPASPA
jgi:hypothetical protein